MNKIDLCIAEFEKGRAIPLTKNEKDLFTIGYLNGVKDTMDVL